MEYNFESFSILNASIYRSLQKIKSEVMENYGFKNAHVMCLYRLGKTDGITATELAESTGCDKAAVSRCLNDLEKKNLIKKYNPKGNTYRAVITLSSKGKKLFEDLEKTLFNMENCIFNNFEDQEKEMLWALLMKVEANLENM